jgi:uncharacterized protein
MADSTQGQDPSMEDILASIRRIIDEDERKAPGATPSPVAVSPDDDEVLELTEAIEEWPEEAESEVSHGDDVTMPDDAEAVLPRPETPIHHEPEPEPAAKPAFGVAAASHEDRMTASSDERLVSDAAYTSAAAALGSLARAAERDPLDGVERGRPVEDLVMDLLKPMLREWLDQNLPTIVERVVEREVRYLSRRLESDDRA